MTPTEQLFAALRQGDAATVTGLVQGDATLLATRDPRGSTPLLLATYLQQEAVVEALVEAGADVNARDAAGNTPLMGLCFKGYLPLAKYLLAHGADVNVANFTGATALIFAATFNRPAMVDLLLEAGATASHKDDRGLTAADHARNQGQEELAQRLSVPG